MGYTELVILLVAVVLYLLIGRKRPQNRHIVNKRKPRYRYFDDDIGDPEPGDSLEDSGFDE